MRFWRISYFIVIPAFPDTLSKEPFEVYLKWNPLKWNWLLLRNFTGGQKVFYFKKEENSLSDLSHDVKNSFQQMDLITFSFISQI